MRPESPTVLQYGTRPPRASGLVLSGAALLVFVTHVALQFVLYRGRVVDHWACGDFVVFFVPLMLALVGYASVWWHVAKFKPWNGVLKGAFVIALTFVTGFLSVWASLLLPFNVYGT